MPNMTNPDKDHFIIKRIEQEVAKGNKDNISRTKFYQSFYLRHPRISWAFLASMVSRNAGWNMCDLSGREAVKLLDEKARGQMLAALEKANWLIFKDAYPQLLIYQHSKLLKRPLFHLLRAFSISEFMIREWQIYWDYHNEIRLMYALIVNEQHVIQQEVIEHPDFKHPVFSSSYFKILELSHFNCMILPTCGGELYGDSVVKFKKVRERINLGKRLSSILFHPDLHSYFLTFAICTEPTGSRRDYERFMPESRREGGTFMLRTILPVMEHFLFEKKDWYTGKELKNGWDLEAPVPGQARITEWFFKKQKQLSAYYHLRNLM